MNYFIYNTSQSPAITDVTNTGNGERGTGNGERGTGNEEPGTGVWERVYSGNPLENSKWRTKQKKRPQESREETI